MKKIKTNDKFKELRKRLKPYTDVKISKRNILITLLILAVSTVVCILMQRIDGSSITIPMIYVLAVFLISYYTDGFVFGAISSVICVALVNYIFTYPYFAFNFTIAGYPVTFITMFAISVMTSTLAAQMKMQEQMKVAASKEIMRANLLRAVSHDLRTPLTSISGTISALLDNGDKLNKEQKRSILREAKEESDWLVRMVENLLSITRMNGGDTKLYKSPEIVEEIIEESVRKFSKRFHNTKVDVKLPSEVLIAPMDPILIEQVIINLLENAKVHGKSNEPIVIDVSKQENKAVIRVIDRGVGISKEAMDHLFDGFLSGVSEEESDGKRNMGIGLSVCMSIINAHGGEMSAKNNREGGAELCFTLPLE